MGEWIHVKTNSAKKHCFVLKWMAFLSSSVHGCKTSSAKKEGDVEDSSSAQGLGEGRVISFTSSDGLKCLCNYQVWCHKQLRLIKGCILSLHLFPLMVKCCRRVPFLYRSLLRSYAVTCPRSQVPAVPFQPSPCPLHHIPWSWGQRRYCFTWPFLMEKLEGEGGGEASFLLNQPAWPTHFAAWDC